MILFLDDDPNRAVLAYNRMNEKDRSNTIWCKSVEETILTLRDYDLTEVNLDHDLEGNKYVNTKSPECGMEIVRFLENMFKNEPKKFSKFKETKFIVHTWNEHAGPIMTDRLLKIGLDVKYRPFGM